MRVRYIVTALLCALSQALGQWAEIPSGGTDMLPPDPIPALRLSGTNRAHASTVEVDGMPFTRALRVVTEIVPENPWGFQILANTAGEIRTGDVILISMFARGAAERSDNGTARAVAYIQMAQSPHTKLGTLAMDPGSEWRQYLMPFRASMNLSPGQHNLTIFLGYYAQTVEIGGVRIVNYGSARDIPELPRTRYEYAGRAPDAAWRAAAAERINQLRKADLAVRVTDAEGRPVPGARVRMELRRHAFGFGSAVVARLLATTGPNQELYRAAVSRHFNKVVFENDLKWPQWVTSKTNTDVSFRQTWTDAALAWLAERGIAVRGHFLSWGATDSANGVGPGNHPIETVPDRLLAHIAEIAPAIGERVVEWDTINHPVPGWAPSLEQRFGPDLYTRIFEAARAAAPASVAHWINEGDVAEGTGSRDRYERCIRLLIDAGQAPDGIGFMGHFSEASLTGMDALYRVFDRFAALVPNLQFTELDVNTTDEELQADYLRDVMTLAFSHPSFSGIVMWGFWEGAHWRPDAALWRRDWQPKPAAHAFTNLVFRDWWTRAEEATGESGKVGVRGFLGEYDITVETAEYSQTRRVTLSKEGLELEWKLE